MQQVGKGLFAYITYRVGTKIGLGNNDTSDYSVYRKILIYWFSSEWRGIIYTTLFKIEFVRKSFHFPIAPEFKVVEKKFKNKCMVIFCLDKLRYKIKAKY